MKTRTLPLTMAAAAVLLMSLARDARADFERTSWGMSAAEIQKLYPGGSSHEYRGGETHYRVIQAAYGQPSALVTFCIRSETGLSRIAVEIAARNAQAAPGAYNRPASGNAAEIRDDVVKAITADFGAPTTIEGSVPGAGVVIWDQKRPEWAVLASIPDASGRVQLLLRLYNLDHCAPSSFEDSDAGCGFWATPPAFWSAEGSFGAKWGMGPADVRASYPNLAGDPSVGGAVQAYTAKADVEGRVDIRFDFFKGRLVALTLSPGYLMESARWRERILTILRNKYGAPIEAPTAAQVQTAESGASAEPHALAWRWIHDGTRIVLDYVAPATPRLQYIEVASREELEASRRALEAAIAKKSKDRF